MKSIFSLLTAIFFILTPIVNLSAANFAPLGTPDPEDIQHPDGEPPSEEVLLLGKMLFFEPRVSVDGTNACAMCHMPGFGLSDGVALDRLPPPKAHPVYEGVARNASTLYNIGFNPVILWDGISDLIKPDHGGVAPFEELMMVAFMSRHLRHTDLKVLEKNIAAIPYYKDALERLYPDTGVTAQNIANVMGAFLRNIVVNDSAFDKYIQGDLNALQPSQVRGLALFQGKANCVACHDGVNFTDAGFHNIGIGGPDRGRAKVLELMKGAKVGNIKDSDIAANEGAFKTPTLRNVALTHPYMHDGSIKTLEEVVQHYNKGGNPAPNLSPDMKPLGLTDTEVADLVTFLGALTDPFIMEAPQLPR